MFNVSASIQATWATLGMKTGMEDGGTTSSKIHTSLGRPRRTQTDSSRVESNFSRGRVTEFFAVVCFTHSLRILDGRGTQYSTAMVCRCSVSSSSPPLHGAVG